MFDDGFMSVFVEEGGYHGAATVCRSVGFWILSVLAAWVMACVERG